MLVRLWSSAGSLLTATCKSDGIKISALFWRDYGSLHNMFILLGLLVFFLNQVNIWLFVVFRGNGCLNCFILSVS